MSGSKGYFGIGLHNPKNEINVGSAMRGCQVYGGKFLVASGRRLRSGCSDPSKNHLHIPYFRANDLMEHVPYSCIPVAVDLVEGAVPLPEFVHPERAFYVFGPEDGTLGEAILEQCVHKVYIPAPGNCLNLGTAVTTVLYDRALKENYNLTEKE